ncbi:hypothetical protein [Candidatus Methanodesulfokora washburnensis]|uniref:Uncharacterized protein n=1 Tax=Candidatus Methanodesulfokora washburnensis TaxID=2478471 RepID=A0A3R9QV87_9CREN|nr:hypothetical protein [Candidatus Methanodesulfokores washburnensis]RSN72973.1 hypothetical protein D6D85_11825 [Candidatus Methanodesulfokores washburnensis]
MPAYVKVLEKLGTLKGDECATVPEVFKPDEEATQILKHAEYERIRTYGKKVKPAGYLDNYEDMIRHMNEVLTAACKCETDKDKLKEIIYVHLPEVIRKYDKAHEQAHEIYNLSGKDDFYYFQEHLVNLWDTWEDALINFIIRCLTK